MELKDKKKMFSRYIDFQMMGVGSEDMEFDQRL
jgi:hypothetical protein